jgi:DNA-binding CsgD family transcriptional regulator
VQQRLTAPGFQQPDGLRLEAWLTRLAALPELQRSSFTDTFEVIRSQAQAKYSVQCCPLEPIDPLSKSEGAHHIVFVTDPQRLELPTAEHLQRQFGLTPAEVRVTHAMVQGGSYSDVAQALGVSEETIRTQIRATYAKTRTADKASLTRMVLSLGKAVV